MLSLLPEKHVRLNETLLGLGAMVVLQLGEEGLTIDELWDRFRELKLKKRAVPERIGFEDLILTIDFLFALRAIRINAEGEIFKCA
jgi:hypothetical protein